METSEFAGMFSRTGNQGYPVGQNDTLVRSAPAGIFDFSRLKVASVTIQMKAQYGAVLSCGSVYYYAVQGGSSL